MMCIPKLVFKLHKTRHFLKSGIWVLSGKWLLVISNKIHNKQKYINIQQGKQTDLIPNKLIHPNTVSEGFIIIFVKFTILSQMKLLILKLPTTLKGSSRTD